MSGKTLIVGMGNLLYRDEGIGVHIIQEMRKMKLPSHIELLDIGTSTMDLISYLKEVKKLIVIDAMRAGGKPGTIYKCKPGDLLPKGEVLSLSMRLAFEAALKAGITTTQAAFDTTDPAAWASWIYDASKTILNASTHLPTHMFVSPSFWAELGKLSDTADRPLFPQIGPMNAFGNVSPGTLSANAFGLSVVVCPYESDFLAIGAADGFEIYEQQKGAIQVEATDGSLSRLIKFRGYLATLMIDASKFVEIA